MFILDWKAKFQIVFGENKVIFFPSKYMDPQQFVHELQVKNHCFKMNCLSIDIA